MNYQNHLGIVALSGVHQLGPGGYRVAKPVWDKEDAERAEQGLPPRFEKYSD